jgi:hypothetical protein
VCSSDLNRLTEERDAAIRERDELRVKRDELQTGCNRLNAQLAKKDAPYKTALDAAIKGMERAQRERDDAINEYHSVSAERDKLQARFPELEAAAKLAPDANDDGGSNHAAQAASGGGEGEPAQWAVMYPTGRLGSSFDTKEHAESLARNQGLYELTVVPLYRQPPQPRGWLSEEERKWIEYMKGNCVLPYAGMACMEAILARSSPPEVVLPVEDIVWNEEGRRVRKLDPIKVREALTSEGVLFKEAT